MFRHAFFEACFVSLVSKLVHVWHLEDDMFSEACFVSLVSGLVHVGYLEDAFMRNRCVLCSSLFCARCLSLASA